MPETIEIITCEPAVEALLAPYEPDLGEDLAGYRGHIYRVLTYALHFLGADHANKPELEAALVFHDIGLWTDGELAYLEPSMAEADRVLSGHDIDHDLVRRMIWNHHKITPYVGPKAGPINAMRKADWIDATKGRMRKGLSRAQIAKVEAAIPNAGFHDALDRLAGELNGGNRTGGLMRVLRRVYKL